MKNTLLIAAMGVTLCFGSARQAQAQQLQWTDTGFVNVSFGAQAPSRTLTVETRPEVYGEEARVTTTQDVGGGGFFDISAGYKVWRNMAVGLGYTNVGSDATVNAAADIPDPLFFDRLRPANATVSDLSHRQPALNFSATWMMPITDKVDVGFVAGPTIFFASQELPGTPEVTEPGPSIAFPSVVKQDKTTAGIHFGVDATYLITPRFGAGVLLRYTYGSATFDGATDSVALGGFQIGFGLRARF
jgi:hypothetical protein